MESRDLGLAMALLVVTLVGNSQTLLSFLLSPGFQHHIKWVWRYMPVMLVLASSLLLFVFETGFLCVALAILELTLQTRLASKSEIQLTLPPECWD